MISKSKYCQAVQCPKMLWLKKYKPELFDDSVMNNAVLERGNEVGDLAMGLFGEFQEIPFTPEKFGVMLGKTKQLMSEGVPIITEAAFSKEGLFCMVDILKNIDGKAVELYEVKSSTKIKDIYVHDAAFQRYILTESGYDVRRVCLVHINNKYVRNGEIDIQELFTVEDITEIAVRKHKEVATNVLKFKEYLKKKDEPSLDIGEHCFDPYPCGFWKHCSRHLPSPNVFDMANMTTKKKVAHYRNGIVSFMDLYSDDTMTEGQKMQVEGELMNRSVIDPVEIRSFLSTLSYPMYLLDFETFAPAVPLYDGTRPYEQVPFQYSLHYMQREGGELFHKEFLAEAGKDPRRALAERLCEDIPTDVCVVAYNMRFEKTVIKALAKQFPDLESHLMNIHDRMKDIMLPFSQKLFYLPAMKGSYSIKYVLPALFPNDPSLNYSSLDGVHNGEEASNSFARMAEMDEQERENLRKNLLKYCALDTLAMVKVLEKLIEVSRY